MQQAVHSLVKKSLKCPVCSKGRIVDIPIETHNESVDCILPGQIEQADCYVKCPKCGSQIGISFLHN